MNSKEIQLEDRVISVTADSEKSCFLIPGVFGDYSYEDRAAIRAAFPDHKNFVPIYMSEWPKAFPVKEEPETISEEETVQETAQEAAQETEKTLSPQDAQATAEAAEYQFQQDRATQRARDTR